MEVFTETDAARRKWNVLAHPFYTRWSEGALSLDELALYAGLYRHAVVALADASTRAGRELAAARRLRAPVARSAGTG